MKSIIIGIVVIILGLSAGCSGGEVQDMDLAIENHIRYRSDEYVVAKIRSGATDIIEEMMNRGFRIIAIIPPIANCDFCSEYTLLEKDLTEGQ